MPRASQQSDLLSGFNAVDQFKSALRPRIPWGSIVDFATHESFCDQRLYPRQLTLLKLIYLETESMTQYDLDVIGEWQQGFTRERDRMGVQPDIWERVKYLRDRGYRHFPHIESVMGRRASKGKIGGLLGAEKLAYMFALDDWQDHYGISPGKDGYLSVVATTQQQAMKFQFADVREAIESCNYLKPHLSSVSDRAVHIRTPGDLRRIARMKADGVPLDREIATLRAVAMSSTSASGRGGTGFMNMFDEFAHMITGSGGPRSSEEVYEAYQPSLDQFGTDSMTYIPSSPFTKVGKFFELYEAGRVLMSSYRPDGSVEYVEQTERDLDVDAEEEIAELTADPEMLIIQVPSWELYRDWDKSPSMGGPRFKGPIQVYNDRMKRFEKRNPDKFKVERKAQFASVIDGYLDEGAVERMFDPLSWREPLRPTLAGQPRYAYRGHADPGLSNANFAMAIGHLEDAPPDEFGDIWPHVIFDFLHVWKPGDYDDHIVPYPQITKQIGERFRMFPSLTDFTFDQWNSASSIATLREEFSPRVNIRVEEFSKSSNFNRAEHFKSAINLGWVHAYKDTFFGESQSLLEQELKFLQEKNGLIVKQDFGPVTTKDLADCVMEVTVSLLQEHLDRWANKVLGKMHLAAGITASGALRSERGQDMVNMMRNGRSARETIQNNSIERMRGRSQSAHRPGRSRRF
ncbi:putative terminase large subunit [Rhodococcus phage E3]|uniref:putative terminase large subunit n=1 Tax=Rhodococcus phage E3 TaxID=1007869 RepID=UPI0002C6E0BE|nr:putative terminase large subunit [Rhodococcus phage E3]AEQ20915.1 putative terminase large subunit [Rhodococcus phage E3]